eukprot:scaffold462_cov195-Pinguiococcus_pyrenoidosus.AAC.65
MSRLSLVTKATNASTWLAGNASSSRAERSCSSVSALRTLSSTKVHKANRSRSGLPRLANRSASPASVPEHTSLDASSKA